MDVDARGLERWDKRPSAAPHTGGLSCQCFHQSNVLHANTILRLGRLHSCIVDLRVCVHRKCNAYIGVLSSNNPQGFVGGAVANMYLTPYIGFGKASVLIPL